MKDKELRQLKAKLWRAKMANAVSTVGITAIHGLHWCSQAVHKLACRLANWIYPEVKVLI